MYNITNVKSDSIIRQSLKMYLLISRNKDCSNIIYILTNKLIKIIIKYYGEKQEGNIIDNDLRAIENKIDNL